MKQDSKSQQPLPKKKNLPLFSQLINSCGLASILMTLDLPNNPELSQFVSRISNLITPLVNQIFPDAPKEYLFQYALQYLLLKIQSIDSPNYEFLYSWLTEMFPESYVNQKTIANYIYANQREKYIKSGQFDVVKAYDRYILEGDLVNSYLLKDTTHSQKIDIELKLLMAVLGFKFHAFPSDDGTGSLYLTKKNKKIFLKQLINGFLDPNKIAIIGMENHWVALEGLYSSKESHWVYKIQKQIQKSKPEEKTEEKTEKKNKRFDLENLSRFNVTEMIIEANNPIIPSCQKFQLKQVIQKVRFYFFQKTAITPTTYWEKILSQIKIDVPQENQQYSINLNQKKENESLSNSSDVLKEEEQETEINGSKYRSKVHSTKEDIFNPF